MAKKTITKQKKLIKQKGSVNKNKKPNKDVPKVTVNKPVQNASGQFFSPYDWKNVGWFRKQYGRNTLVDADVAVNGGDRRGLVDLSRQLFSQMGELTAASKQKASWVVGGGFDPVYNGKDKVWGQLVTDWLTKKWYSSCNIKGFAYDFKSSLKIASRMLDRDGDILMALVNTRNGWPLLQFIETHNIGQRKNPLGDEVITEGKYAGYDIKDGVIFANNERPIAYSILGKTEIDDVIVTTQQAALIVDPDFFTNGRGLPIISAALSDGLNLQEIDFYLCQLTKRQAQIQVVETNQQGSAPLEDLTTFANLGGDETNGASLTPYNPIPLEMVNAGTTYLKANAGEKLESFDTKLPALETQAFVKRIEKRLLAAVGWPHEILLSPEDAGGASVRGIAEMVRKTIFERQTVLEKYAKVALIYAISTAMENGIIPSNYTEDFTDWSFTKGPQLVLDAGYERDADRKDLIIGAKSLDDITRKYGKTALEVREQLTIETDDLLKRAIELNKKYPQFDVNRCLDLLSQRGANSLPPAPTENEVVDAPAKNTTK